VTQDPFTDALENLLASGELTMPHPLIDARLDRVRAATILECFERDYRQEMPGTPPAFDRQAALWAAELFLRACQFHAHRDVDRELMLAALAAELPAGRKAATHYAVDLVFRFLPDLLRLVNATNPRDALAAILKQWAQQWPLSSVGIKGLETDPFELEPILGDSCLRIVYVDRIVATQDATRVGDLRVKAWLAALNKTLV
jgi:hypothetical protein